jgi:hypothetical protein
MEKSGDLKTKDFETLNIIQTGPVIGKVVTQHQSALPDQ